MNELWQIQQEMAQFNSQIQATQQQKMAEFQARMSAARQNMNNFNPYSVTSNQMQPAVPAAAQPDKTIPQNNEPAQTQIPPHVQVLTVLGEFKTLLEKILERLPEQPTKPEKSVKPLKQENNESDKK